MKRLKSKFPRAFKRRKIDNPGKFLKIKIRRWSAEKIFVTAIDRPM